MNEQIVLVPQEYGFTDSLALTDDTPVARMDVERRLTVMADALVTFGRFAHYPYTTQWRMSEDGRHAQCLLFVDGVEIENDGLRERVQSALKPGMGLVWHGAI